MDRATEALAGKSKKPAKKLREIRTRKGKSGGFIHEHHFSSGHEPEEHVSPDKEAMVAHMMQAMGGGASAAPAPAPDPDAGQAAPAQAPAAPAGPPGM